MRLEEGIDYILDEQSGLIILTAFFLENRGYCCGNKCKNCPYTPKWLKGNKQLDNINHDQTS